VGCCCGGRRRGGGWNARTRRLANLLGLGRVRLSAAEADDAWDEHAALVGDRPGDGHGGAGGGRRPSRLPGLLGELTAELAASRVPPAWPPASARDAAGGTPSRRAHQLTYPVGETSVLRARRPVHRAGAGGPRRSAIAVLRAVRTSSTRPAGSAPAVSPRGCDAVGLNYRFTRRGRP